MCYGLFGGGEPGGPGWASGFLHCLLGCPFLFLRICLTNVSGTQTIFISGSASETSCHTDLTSPHFSTIDVMATGCSWLHQHQEEKGVDTPPHGFHSENWLAHHTVGVADVVDDVHLATMTNLGAQILGSGEVHNLALESYSDPKVTWVLGGQSSNDTMSK